MNLYFDLDQKALVSAPGVVAPLKTLNFIRGDDTDLRVGFIRAGALVELNGDFSIVFVIKQSPGPAVAALAVADTWTFEDDYYTANLDMTGEVLNGLVGTEKSISLLCELTYTDETSGPNTSQLVTAKVGGDLWRGDEAPPEGGEEPDPWLDTKAVRHDVGQSLSSGAKQQARENIGAIPRNVEIDGDFALNHDFVSADIGKYFRLTYSVDHTFTVPNDSTLSGLQIGDSITLRNANPAASGRTLTIVAGADATFNGEVVLLPNQSAQLLSLGDNEWDIL